jgi:hypothetical protein
MVDPPAPIVPEGVSKVVPMCILDALRMRFTENIRKSRYGFLVGIARIDVEIGVVDAAA